MESGRTSKAVTLPWNGNGDGVLDEGEFYGGLYDTWDVNDDGQVDESEWNTAGSDFNLGNQTWSEWDTGGDGALDTGEFRSGLADSGWYCAWDADHDNTLSQREYSDGLFGLWDKNGDRELDESEYRAYNTYYGS